MNLCSRDRIFIYCFTDEEVSEMFYDYNTWKYVACNSQEKVLCFDTGQHKYIIIGLLSVKIGC